MRDPQRDTTQTTAPQAPADPLASAVARAVSELRHAAGLSERAAARKLGTSQTQLRRMEDPRYLPSLRSLARLATVYGYDLRVDFTQKGAATRTKDAPLRAKGAVKKTTKKKRASGSASPSKARAGAPRRGRAAARVTARRAAPRRRS